MNDPRSTQDYLLGQMNEKLDSILHTVTAHEPRLCAMEEWKTKVTAYGAGILAVFSAVFAVVRVIHH